MVVCVLSDVHGVQHDLRSGERVGDISRSGLEELDDCADGRRVACFGDHCSGSLFVHSEKLQI